jgi:hydroxylamine reductase
MLIKEGLMFCYQCEQTAKGEGCLKVGVCGKQPDVAALQDLLVYVTAEMSWFAREAAKHGIKPERETNLLAAEALFHTLTNVDFDPERLRAKIGAVVANRDDLAQDLGEGETPPCPQTPTSLPRHEAL